MIGWIRKSLGDLTTKIGSGATPRGGEDAYKPSGIALIRSLNVYDDGFRDAKLARIDQDQADRLSNVEVGPDDVLFNITGASIARCCLAPLDYLPARVNQHVSIVRTKSKVLLPTFLRYLLISPEYKNRLLQTGDDGGSTRQAITKAQLQGFEIRFPESLAEQQRIVAFLDEAFAGIAAARANAEKNLQNARALFESHLNAVFTQGSQSAAEGRGDGWVGTTLGEATAGIFTGPFGSLLHKSDYVTNQIPLVNPAHITEVGIEADERKTVSRETAERLKSYIMSEGDIVIGRRGEMGRCALITEKEHGWLCGTGSFFIKPSRLCDTRFLVRFLRSEGCKRKLEKIAGGAVMPNLSNTELSNLRFELPPLDRQIAILQEIDEIHEETQRLESIYQRKIAALDELKKSLLHEAFSMGK